MQQHSIARLLQTVSEATFQAQIVQAARYTGWMCYHTYDSRRSTQGYPDLTLVRADGTGLLMPELKTERGRLTAAQSRWLDALRANGVEAPVWRPHDIDEILERLQR